MELIDTHCHLTFEPLAGDVPGVIERSRAAGVTGWITVGTILEDSRRAIELAGRYENMYAAVGIHPHEAKDGDAAALEELKRLARQEKVVAIGETGLDFHYNFSKQPDQKRVFAAHLEIASETGLPVVIHSRNAFDETMEILDRSGGGLKGVVFHCFSGSAEQAQAGAGPGVLLVVHRGRHVQERRSDTRGGAGCPAGPADGRDRLSLHVPGAGAKPKAQRAGPDGAHGPASWRTSRVSVWRSSRRRQRGTAVEFFGLHEPEPRQSDASPVQQL